MWNKELTQKILLLRTERLFHSANLNQLLLGEYDPVEVLQRLKKEQPNIQLSTVEKIGFWTSYAYKAGFKEMKKQLDEYSSRSTRGRILKNVLKLMETNTQLPLQDVFDNLYTQLLELHPIRSKEDLLLPRKRTPTGKLYSEPVSALAVAL